METERLYLRTLEQGDLARSVELLNNWEISQWLAVVPYPYTREDAENFYTHNAELYRCNTPFFFAMASRTDNQIMGGIGLRPEAPPEGDDGALGYWLGQPYWGQGFMSEAVKAVLDFGFEKNPQRQTITATTDPRNQPSQNILRKAGFNALGIRPRLDKTQRGSPEVTFWQFNRSSRPIKSAIEGTTKNMR